MRILASVLLVLLLASPSPAVATDCEGLIVFEAPGATVRLVATFQTGDSTQPWPRPTTNREKMHARGARGLVYMDYLFNGQWIGELHPDGERVEWLHTEETSTGCEISDPTYDVENGTIWFLNNLGGSNWEVWLISGLPMRRDGIRDRVAPWP